VTSHQSPNARFVSVALLRPAPSLRFSNAALIAVILTCAALVTFLYVTFAGPIAAPASSAVPLSVINPPQQPQTLPGLAMTDTVGPALCIPDGTTGLLVRFAHRDMPCPPEPVQSPSAQ
jgi:hypothetical protein